MEPRHWDDVAALFTAQGAARRDAADRRLLVPVLARAREGVLGRSRRRPPQRSRTEIRARRGDRAPRLPRRRARRLVPARGRARRFDRLERSAKLARVDDEEVWSIVCFYVDPTAKRQGVAIGAARRGARSRPREGRPAGRGLPGARGPHEHRRVHGLPADVPRRRLRGGARRRPSPRRAPPVKPSRRGSTP